MENLDHIRDELLGLIAAAPEPDALEQIRVGALGRKGRVTELLKSLGSLDPEQRKGPLDALRLGVLDLRLQLDPDPDRRPRRGRPPRSVHARSPPSGR